jgi:hypothetical protein
MSPLINEDAMNEVVPSTQMGLYRNFGETQKMENNNQDTKPGGIFLHLTLLIVGLVMTVLGVALCVTMVLLPVGLPLGLAGLGVLVWGLTPGWRK